MADQIVKILNTKTQDGRPVNVFVTQTGEALSADQARQRMLSGDLFPVNHTQYRDPGPRQDFTSGESARTYDNQRDANLAQFKATRFLYNTNLLNLEPQEAENLAIQQGIYGDPLVQGRLGELRTRNAQGYTRPEKPNTIPRKGWENGQQDNAPAAVQEAAKMANPPFQTGWVPNQQNPTPPATPAGATGAMNTAQAAPDGTIVPDNTPPGITQAAEQPPVSAKPQPTPAAIGAPVPLPPDQAGPPAPSAIGQIDVSGVPQNPDEVIAQQQQQRDEYNARETARAASTGTPPTQTTPSDFKEYVAAMPGQIDYVHAQATALLPYAADPKIKPVLDYLTKQEQDLRNSYEMFRPSAASSIRNAAAALPADYNAEDIARRIINRQLPPDYHLKIFSSRGGEGGARRLEVEDAIQKLDPNWNMSTELIQWHNAMNTGSPAAQTQNAKVDQAAHLQQLVVGDYDATTGNYNVPQSQYEELAMGLAKLISETNTVTDAMRKGILQRTLKGDFNGAVGYALGTTPPATTQAVVKMLIHSIDRQAEVAVRLRNVYLGHYSVGSGYSPTEPPPKTSKGSKFTILEVK